ncbi:flagellin [uncultured Anaerovibrio sp.]|uniref:flagellin n=1 Tax=uncultured Anaerovibrio sp. TaxID=361586 RepID=UPI003415517E
MGCYISRRDNVEANIITDQESTMAAESVIRDADMAKSSLELATAQILSQAGQAMLSQSNQNSSNILSLLQ